MAPGVGCRDEQHGQLEYVFIRIRSHCFVQ